MDDLPIKSLSACRRLVLITAVSFFALLSATPAPAFDISERVQEFTLDNGLKVIFLPRKGAPIFAARIAFKVGSVEERRGLTGAAHMLEHMIFKGTTTLGSLDWKKEEPLLNKVHRAGDLLDKARAKSANKETIADLEEKLKAAQKEHKKYVKSEIYSSIYSAEGGVGFNAGTSKDTTTYIIRLPANKLELWAYIESDRLKDAVLREYYSERDVVMEERRRSYENRPIGKLYERFLAAAFIAHPYGEPIIGWGSEISTLPIAEVKRFWDAWYVPNNAVIGIVGDVDFDHLKKIVTKYFGDIPARPLPARISTVEPPQAGERRITVEFDANPTFIMGFHKPTWPDRDDVVLSVIQGVLSSGRTSRFDKVIVRKNKIALSVETWGAPGSRYPNVFAISGEPRPPHTTLDVEVAVWEELDRLKKEPVTEAELARVKTNMDASFIRGMVSHYGMAHLLTHYEQVTGDWRNVETEREMTNSVTAEDIMRVAKKYFTKDNSTVATLVKKKK